jgi:hypothetical protein
MPIPQLNYTSANEKFKEYPYNPSRCSRFEIMRTRCDQILQKLEHLKEHRPIASSDVQLLKKMKLKYIELYDDLCFELFCPNRSKFNWIYRDGTHISVGNSAKLAGIFGQLLSA